MKIAKKIISMFLTASIVISCCISTLANYEDGLVIPNGNNSSNSYNDLFWNIGNNSVNNDYITIGNGNTYIKDETSNEENDVIIEEIEKPINYDYPETVLNTDVDLAENYTDIYGTDSIPKARSSTGSGRYDYLYANGGYMTITADKPLNNILQYNGNIVSNIHIAKWVSDDPSILEYPAYCKNPGWKGTAQHQDGKYQIDPLDSIGSTEKIILGIARSGYPYKTPEQLGCQSVDEAYYATHGAIHTAIVGGSLDKWSIKSGDEARNTRVLEALKKIYNEGISNPYTPPEFTAKLSPVSGSETATVEGDWVSNTYHFTTDMERDYWKFSILGDDLISMVESGTIEVYGGNKKLSLQTNISGSWDTQKAFKVPMGYDVTVKVKKSVADSTGINYMFYGTTVGGDFSSSVSYLGNPVGLSGNWQGYIYNFLPQSMDTSAMTYSKTPEEPDEPEVSGDGSLLIEKLDYNTKEKVADAVFNIHGVSDSCNHINITVKASNGATIPILGNGGKVELSDGVIKLTGIPAGTYEVTEVSAPPNYSVTVGQNSQSVEVVNDSEIYPKLIFENKPYGSLKIRKVDADFSLKLSIIQQALNRLLKQEQMVKLLSKIYQKAAMK